MLALPAKKRRAVVAVAATMQIVLQLAADTVSDDHEQLEIERILIEQISRRGLSNYCEDRARPQQRSWSWSVEAREAADSLDAEE